MPALSRISLLISATLTVVSLLAFFIMALACRLLRWRSGARTVVNWSMGAPLRAIGLKINVLNGKEKLQEPMIVVSPHFSWLDPLVLTGALGGRVCFVATKEIRRWFLIGGLVAMQGTIFIDRTRRGAVLTQKKQIDQALQKGLSVVFFPEGSSGNGNRLRRFKSSLFSVAMEGNYKIKPLAMAYTRLDGIPMMRLLRPTYAWYGGMALIDHLVTMFGGGRAEVCIYAEKPLDPRKFKDRKQLAITAEKRLRKRVAKLLAACP